VFQSIFDELDAQECRYVFDVLNMYRMLRNGYDELKDKSGIAEADIRFRGFDGNNETKRYAFAEFLQKTGKWQEVLVGGLNSHTETTIQRYPRMLERFERIKKEHEESMRMWSLSAEEIKEIIS